MEHVSPEYEERLKDLAHLLCPLKEVVKINPLSIPRGDDEELYSFQYDIPDNRNGFDIDGNYHRSQNRWDDMGRYVIDL